MTDTAERLYERMLVLRCQAGDETAFAELVERYQGRLRYYLRKMLRETHCVDDVLQDVWFDVFRSVPRLVDVAAFPAWLYRIAHDRAMRELRKQRPPHAPLVDGELVAEKSADVIFTPEEVERIHAALDELPEEHREVLVLRFLDDMTYENIALVTGCPIGTVRSRLYYAKCALRRVIGRMIGHE